MVRILWVEGKRAEGPPFIPNLRKKGYSIEVVSTGAAAIEQLLNIDPDLAVVNASTLRTNGKRICRSLRSHMKRLPIVLIASANPLSTDTDNCANVVLTLPFTYRKLLNRIVPLLPGDGGNMLHVGPIRLDIEHKRVRCQGREARLTPRLVHILRLMMQHPGEVLERANLFREVWVTEYTADTRTLDVHISWLRQALEEDPRKPQFIKTIRGVGYRLDV
jgi:DNA-binding response OmpR family regulator